MNTGAQMRTRLQAQPWLLLLALLLLGGWLGTWPVTAKERVALVIGNADYRQLEPLQNPARDAEAMAKTLRGLGFTLIDIAGKRGDGALHDLDERAFSKAVRAFAKRARGSEIALIYYAGHGMQIDGGSYLLPVDVPADDLELLRRDSLALDNILRRLDGQAALTIAVFDACREIPDLYDALTEATRNSGLGRDRYRGLARVASSGRSRIVAYSGAAGELVKDGNGKKHSPYTALLLEQLAQAEKPVEDVFQQVAWQFGQRHGGQNPEILIQGVRPDYYYFVPPVPPIPPVPLPPPALGHLQLSVDSPAAEVFLNGRKLGTAGPGQPLNRTNLPVGKVQLRVIAPGRKTVTREILIQAGTWTQLALALPSSGPAVGERFRDPLRDGGEGPEMVVVPAGRFRMGSNNGDDDEKPVHWVTISRAFGIGTTEVTFADYDRFARATGRELPKDQGWGRDRRPVINVSWQDATAYADWLSDQTGAEYRLPSEAEWEYAARAGTTTAYWWGDQPPVCRAGAHNGAKFYDNAACDDIGTEPVASYSANPWGLYDTAGNVWEWVEDWYDDYSSGEVVDPVVRQGGSHRVDRGGSWNSSPRYLRSAYRDYWRPGNRDDNLGFRLARTF
jgi:formylglycine-generating enzyme required for sulfatase activity